MSFFIISGEGAKTHWRPSRSVPYRCSLRGDVLYPRQPWRPGGRQSPGACRLRLFRGGRDRLCAAASRARAGLDRHRATLSGRARKPANLSGQAVAETIEVFCMCCDDQFTHLGLAFFVYKYVPFTTLRARKISRGSFYRREHDISTVGIQS